MNFEGPKSDAHQTYRKEVLMLTAASWLIVDTLIMRPPQNPQEPLL
jgi:hypothetical protein